MQQITDLCSLNKVIVCKQYTLPIITNLLDQISGYKFFTKLDISLICYTFELDKPSQEHCVIVTLFGKYKYNHLPMGLKCAPDFAQKSWRKYYVVSRALMYISTILVPSCLPGNTTSYYLTKYSTGWRPMA
ncbi:hypothetical protein ACHAXS_000342 [Conticribra weissflogii]